MADAVEMDWSENEKSKEMENKASVFGALP